MFPRLPSLVAVLALIAAAACGAFDAVRQSEADRAAIKAALDKYLKERAGLNMDAMTYEIIDLNVDRDSAFVKVTFTARESGAKMPMTYEFKREGGAWQVMKSPGAGGAHPGATPPAGAVPQSGELPPGHPALGAPAKTPQAAPPKKP